MTLLGTVRSNSVDKNSKDLVKGQLTKMSEASQGSCCLIRAFEYPPDHQENKKGNKTAMSKVLIKQRSDFVPSPITSERPGFCIFKDKKPVLFYCSDLNGTMTQDVLLGTSEEAIHLAYGLSPLRRWTSNCYVTRQVFNALCLLLYTTKIFPESTEWISLEPHAQLKGKKKGCNGVLVILS